MWNVNVNVNGNIFIHGLNYGLNLLKMYSFASVDVLLQCVWFCSPLSLQLFSNTCSKNILLPLLHEHSFVSIKMNKSLVWINWQIDSWIFFFLSIKRYHQNSKDDDNNKTNNDFMTSGQQAHASVPLCLTSDVQLRFLCPDDLEEVRTLCQDWFPIDYPFSWYEDITSSTRFFALAAVYNLTIIGLIVAEIKPYARLNKEVNHIYSLYILTFFASY